MRRGSITIFLSLTLILVLSFVFSLLEGARVSCMKNRSETVSELCMQSLLGNYHPGLWEDYHLLFLDGTWGLGEFSMGKFAGKGMEEMQENLSVRENTMGIAGWDLVKLRACNVTVVEYALATDGGGEIFRRQVSSQMQREAAEDALHKLLEIQELGSETEGKREEKESQWKQAWEAIDQAEKIQEEESEEEREQVHGETAESLEDAKEAAEEEGDAVLENPMEYVKEIKKSAVLSMVLEDPSKVSPKAIENPRFLSERDLLQGNWSHPEDNGMLDRLWLQYFVQNYFSNYTGTSSGGPASRTLDYEVEYLIGGKDNDSDNLEVVVYELLGIREIMNFITIMQDTQKKNLAFSIATAAVGFTGIPMLVKAVQIGILLAWSYVESVLDIRTLLKGGKTPFLKRTDQWSSDLANCRGSIESDSGSKEDASGMTYAQYLQLLLCLQGEKSLTYRCMDILELNEQVQMDAMVQKAEAVFEYEGIPLFWNFNFLKDSSWDSFSFAASVAAAY